MTAKIQILEDNPDVAQLLTMIIHLERPDVEVTVIDRNFGWAMSEERWEGVDVAVVDLMLPHLDGRTILRWLAEHVPNVRRVVYSAATSLLEPEERRLAHEVLDKSAALDPLYTALGLKQGEPS